ncbi:RpiB/LacA/LacB family sugar-phosphate isomerase [Patescibacteria group bacterium]|nr:RpiB/LacA/LacB family sugar-phosphate isomerase [Patescibacteria group bacterium]
MNIIFAADHAGYELKNALLAYVRDELGYEVFDCGAHIMDDTDDYTTFVGRAADMVSKNTEHSRAIILGGSGQGEAIYANRFKGVRAAVFYGGSLDVVRLSREHNDANVLSLGARFLNEETAKEAVNLWLKTEFSTELRYARRNAAMD